MSGTTGAGRFVAVGRGFLRCAMAEGLLDGLEQWRSFSALVVGDFMLDELVYGDAERLSPDAPVPVLLVRKRELRPGGASNVCMDLAALRGRVTALGVTGDDETARKLKAALEKDGVDTGGLVADAARPTTLKQNLIGLAQSRHPQKMFRVDEESRDPVAQAVQDRLFARRSAARLRRPFAVPARWPAARAAD